MTRTANARIAGFTFLFYIAVGIAGMVVFQRATGGAVGTAATLASLANNASLVRLSALLAVVTVFCALALGVTLWALTRDVDRDLAAFALCCRLGEGLVGAVAAVATLGLLSVANASTSSLDQADAAALNALGALLLRQGGNSTTVSATLFAAGSTIFAWLFLRARSIPLVLAWIGVFASLLLVVGLPAQLFGLFGGTIGWLLWLPMLVFEVWLALWLLIRGVAEPAVRQA